MKISNYTKKPKWERRQVGCNSYGPECALSYSNGADAFRFDSAPKVLLSQSDFLSELHPSSHRIYDVRYRSMRPRYRWDAALQKNVFDGYEEVERVGVSLQQAILRHKSTHAFGNPVWFGNEGDEDDTDFVAKVKHKWNSVNMKAAISQWARQFFSTGDGAICLYRDEDNGKLRYRVFGFEKGDIVGEYRDPVRRKRAVVRMFKREGVQCVELYTYNNVELWANSNNTSDPIIQKWSPTSERSEDGYILVERKAHGLTQCPVVYHREQDVCWGNVQGNIEDMEKLLSDLHENGKYYNFQFLFVRGGMVSAPQVNFQGKVIVSRTSEGDAKILAPADASNTFTLSLDECGKAIADGSGSVFIRPDTLKGGDYSGAYLRNLYFPETQWCEEFYTRFDIPFRTLLEIFQQFVGIIEGDEGRYMNLDISYEFTPFIPSNEQEEITNINNSVAAGTLSRETSTEEHPYANPAELKRLKIDDKRKVEQEANLSKAKGGSDSSASQTQITTNTGESIGVKPPDNRLVGSN